MASQTPTSTGRSTTGHKTRNTSPTSTVEVNSTGVANPSSATSSSSTAITGAVPTTSSSSLASANTSSVSPTTSVLAGPPVSIATSSTQLSGTPTVLTIYTSSSTSTTVQSAAMHSNNSATHRPSTPANTVSVGALAGGIVGAAIVAALIAFAVTFLCMRHSNGSKAAADRRQSRNHRPHRSSAYVGVSGSKSGHEKSAAQYDRHAWEQHLPQGLDDRSVQTSVKALFDQIQLHVENYYTTADVKITQEVAASLSAVQTPHLTEPITSVMASSGSHLPIIKHCLAYMVSQGIVNGEGTTLLPLSYAIAMNDGGMNPNLAASRQAFSRWRQLTAYFQPEPYSNADSAKAHERSISTMIETFADAFFLWKSQPKDEAPARQHLVELLRNASNLATMLFAQPSSYEFTWPTPPREGGKRRSLPVIPAFDKVANEDGHALEQPQNLMQALLERL